MLFKRQVSLRLACLTTSCGSKNSWNFGGNQPLLQQSVVVSFCECFRVDAMVAFLLIHLRILDFQANAKNCFIRKNHSDMEDSAFTDRRKFWCGCHAVLGLLIHQDAHRLKTKKRSSSRMTTSVYHGHTFRHAFFIQ